MPGCCCCYFYYFHYFLVVRSHRQLLPPPYARLYSAFAICHFAAARSFAFDSFADLPHQAIFIPSAWHRRLALRRSPDAALPSPCLRPWHHLSGSFVRVRAIAPLALLASGCFASSLRRQGPPRIRINAGNSADAVLILFAAAVIECHSRSAFDICGLLLLFRRLLCLPTRRHFAIRRISFQRPFCQPSFSHS